MSTTGPVFTYAFSWLLEAAGNQIVSFNSTVVVPPSPGLPVTGGAVTIYQWPGLQPLPQDPSFLPIDNGVLQPVLAFGQKCNQVNHNNGVPAYTGACINGEYYNTFGTYPGFSGGFEGPLMDVNPGDHIRLDMVLAGNVWTQTVTRIVAADGQYPPPCLAGSGTLTPRGCQVTFSKDMQGQKQQWAEWVTELWGGALTQSSLSVYDVAIALDKPEPSYSNFCRQQVQPYACCSGIAFSQDKTTCLVDACGFAAMATPQNPTTPLANVKPVCTRPSVPTSSPSSSPSVSSSGSSSTSAPVSSASSSASQSPASSSSATASTSSVLTSGSAQSASPARGIMAVGLAAAVVLLLAF
ncbi:hypothetical protein DFJ73DRAFT_775967 [Zopfochytrium polystomum]|nr:hypothetical protein DFJ73DRAFT_775967 [Zopfochytrium polystomum]